MELEQAVELLLRNTTTVEETEGVPISDALQRVLAEDIHAARDQPPFPRSPLDGYALRSADIAGASRERPRRLTVVAEIDAGHVSERRIGPGEAARIMTGAPIPEGADCVVRQEDTDCGEETVKIFEAVGAYENYCQAGEDFRAGEVLLRRGALLGPLEIGILASLGLAEAPVRRSPRLLILSTGDELIEPGQALQPGKIYDSNLYVFDAYARAWGAVVAKKAIVGDDAALCAGLIRTYADDADLIVTTGGVSVGKKDIMHEVIELLPARRLFWKVEIKPGSPMLGALYGGKPLLCVSGNPYGAFVTLQLLVRPVYAKLALRGDLPMRTLRAVTGGPFPKASGMRRYVRAHYEDGLVTPTGGSNGNGVLSTLRGCNCLMEIPRGSPPVKEGQELWVHLL